MERIIQKCFIVGCLVVASNIDSKPLVRGQFRGVLT
jgi:hypothetical protein